MSNSHRPNRRRSPGGVVALVAACLALQACDDPRDPAQSRSVSLCDVIRAGCERQTACGLFVHNTAVQVDECVAASGCAEQEAIYAGHGVSLRADAAQRCIAGLAGSRCDELFVTAEGTSGSVSALAILPGCRQLFAGTREAGASCVDDLECGPGLTCDLGGDTCPGTCAMVACTAGSCGDGRFCDEASRRCQPRADPGQRCAGSTFESTCVDGYHCLWDGDVFEDRCVPQFSPGEACEPFDAFPCAGGTVCDVTMDVCTPPRAPGQPCVESAECTFGAYCEPRSKTCRPWEAEGGRCDASWEACGPDAYCLHYDVECIDESDCGPGRECCDGACVADSGEGCGAPPRGSCRPEPVEDWPYQPSPLQRVTPRPVAGPGEPCDHAVCGLGLVCRAVDEPAAGWRCEPAPRLGESCAPRGEDVALDALNQRAQDARIGCAEGVCDTLVLPPSDWTCVEPKPAGGPCSREGFTRECHSGRCEGGRCLEFLASCRRPIFP